MTADNPSRPDLAAILARCQRATQGPWTCSDTNYDEYNIRSAGTPKVIGPKPFSPEAIELGGCIATVWDNDGWSKNERGGRTGGREDANFIAHARNDVLDLIAWIYALEARMLELEQEKARDTV